MCVLRMVVATRILMIGVRYTHSLCKNKNKEHNKAMCVMWFSKTPTDTHNGNVTQGRPTHSSAPAIQNRDVVPKATTRM